MLLKNIIQSMRENHEYTVYSFMLLMALNAFIGLRVCTVIDGLGPDKTMEQFRVDIKRAFGYIMVMLAVVETLILGGVIVLTNHGIM